MTVSQTTLSTFLPSEMIVNLNVARSGWTKRSFYASLFESFESESRRCGGAMIEIPRQFQNKVKDSKKVCR